MSRCINKNCTKCPLHIFLQSLQDELGRTKVVHEAKSKLTIHTVQLGIRHCIWRNKMLQFSHYKVLCPSQIFIKHLQGTFLYIFQIRVHKVIFSSYINNTMESLSQKPVIPSSDVLYTSVPRNGDNQHKVDNVQDNGKFDCTSCNKYFKSY